MIHARTRTKGYGATAAVSGLTFDVVPGAPVAGFGVIAAYSVAAVTIAMVTTVRRNA